MPHPQLYTNVPWLLQSDLTPLGDAEWVNPNLVTTQHESLWKVEIYEDKQAYPCSLRLLADRESGEVKLATLPHAPRPLVAPQSFDQYVVGEPRAERYRVDTQFYRAKRRHEPGGTSERGTSGT